MKWMNPYVVAIVIIIFAILIVGYILVSKWSKSKKIKLPGWIQEKAETQAENKPESEYKVANDLDKGLNVAIVRKAKHFPLLSDMYFSKIDKPIGNPFWAEPGMPFTGPFYWAKEIDNGYEPFDPRLVELDSNELPTKAHAATHCEIAEAMWRFSSSLMETIGKLLPWITLATGILVLIWRLDVRK